MPIRSDIANQALVGQLRADRGTPRGGQKRAEPSGTESARVVRADVKPRAQEAASSRQADLATKDRVEISLAANLTV